MPALLLFTGALLLVGAYCRPINHDESQYVAASALMRSGLPYRDFAYLQTPLQPLLFWPLALLPAGWTLVASRLVNLMLAMLAMGLTLWSVRPMVPRWALICAAVGMAGTETFLFAGSVARNDALPMALLAAAMALLLRGERRGTFGLAGLCLGLAASAKASFLFPALGAMLFLWRRQGYMPNVEFGAGLLLGLLPTAGLALLAPAEFRFNVFAYGIDAPLQWHRETGRAAWLGGWATLHRLAGFALMGPMLLCLVAVLFDRRHNAPARRLLDWMVLGGTIAAFLPVPSYVQYLVPLLPPLIARAALALPAIGTWQRRLVLLLAPPTLFWGLQPTIQALRHASKGGSELSMAVGQAAVIRSLVYGPVATLSPERIAGAGLSIDPRFAAGPFLFRTRGELAQKAGRLGRAVTFGQLGELEKFPPAALLAGAEKRPHPRHPRGLDAHLAAWADQARYQPHDLGDGFVLWVAPTSGMGNRKRPPIRSATP